ncbi:MAG: hypothetical protein IPI49_08080 [Myxococcales bacterium]|nr:hypothetical protein [Myxococcales bacterium]
MITSQTLAALHGADLDTVRRHVRRVLEQTPSYGKMPAQERRALAGSMVQVLSYLSHPYGGSPALRAAGERQARAGHNGQPLAQAAEVQKQAQQSTEARDALQSRLAEKPGLVGNEMQGNLAGKTGEIAGKLVREVDFPKFVSALIEGVFTSIVNSSIRQMHEFSKYLQAVAMTLKDFAATNSNVDEGRDHLAAQNPRTLMTEERDGQKRLTRRPGVDDEAMPNLAALLGLGEDEDIDLDDDESEAKVAEAAQLQLARMRQQQLATMVMMGINRIVVTEGEIKASVVFDVSAREDASRTATAASADVQAHTDTAHQYEYQRNRSFWGTSRSGSGSSASEVNTRVSSATTNLEDKSDGHIEAKAKMTGSVLVKFKSETFPLERLASPSELAAVQERSAK